MNDEIKKDRSRKNATQWDVRINTSTYRYRANLTLLDILKVN